MPIVLYRFRYLDPIRKKWMTSRYMAREEVIAAQYDEYELIEPPEVRTDADPSRLTAGHLAGPRQ